MVKAKARKREQNKGKELKTEVLSSFPWQRVKDSNPHKRSQSPVCYHYTNPLSCACSSDDSRKCIYYYMHKCGNVK